MNIQNDISAFGNAKYIKSQQSPADFSLYDPLPLFRKEIEINEDIREAYVSVQSPGFAEFYINGKRITDDIFISAISDYNKILWYNTYNAAPFLKKGKNVIAVIAGNGFFNESFETPWKYHIAPWRDAPQFILKLTVNGKTAAVSDKSFRASKEKSPIIYSHLRSGEYFDARKNDTSWMFEEYDDSEWDSAIESDKAPKGKFLKICCQPVREVEELSPTAITKTADGYLVDFGVTISGYIGITVKEERGTEIVFRYAEDVDGNLRPQNNKMDGHYPQSPFQINKLIASGDYDTFKPKFSYHGFRYVSIEGLTNAPDPSSVRAYFTHNDVSRKSFLETGDKLINFIYNAGIRSTYSNMFWCLTDCPTREKLGWMNDAQASMEQVLIDFDIVPLLRKWFEDIKVGMRDDGMLTGVIPSSGWGEKWGPVCDYMLYELPYRIYVYTGDSSLLTGAIEYFDRYADYFEKRLIEGYEFALGDWTGHGNSPLIPKKFVFDFYFVKVLKSCAFAHRLANFDDNKWECKYREEREKFLNTYIDADGNCTIDEQSALAMILVSGLYRDKNVIADRLIKVIHRDGMKLTSGMVGIQYLYDALTESGRADIAYKIITESEPGYKTWYDSGATTLWERFNGVGEDSHNHHMFSNIISWFYKSLLGISPSAEHPGFEEIELKPNFIKDLRFARGTMDTVRGRIEAEWKFENDKIRYTVRLPEDIRAKYNGQQLHTGDNTFIIKL